MNQMFWEALSSLTLKNWVMKDISINGTFFDKDIVMFQNEFRYKTKYLVDFGFVNGYKSSNTNKKNLNHISLN